MSRHDESSPPARDRDPDRTVFAPTAADAGGGAARAGSAAAGLDGDLTVARTSHPAAVLTTAGSSNVLPNGARVAEFEIVSVVGEGGFGVVYRAYDHLLRRNVALKEYMPSALAARQADLSVSVKSDQHVETFITGLRSFINEAHLLAQFDHPALVKVFRFWEANKTAYMVMPLYEGGTLKQYLKARSSPPDEAWLRALLAPLLDALDTLHRANCLHRDIAPDNILLIDGRLPLLLDFGAARRVIGEQTQALTVILKPGFAPIEQYDEIPGMKQGPWTDLYALAAVIHFAITSRPPPPSVGRLVHDQYQPLAMVARNLGGVQYSAPFLAALDAALAVRPEARPQSAAEIRRRLVLAAPASAPIDALIGTRVAKPMGTPEFGAHSVAAAPHGDDLPRAPAHGERKRAAFPALVLLGVCAFVTLTAVSLLLLDWRTARPIGGDATAGVARGEAPMPADGASNGANGGANSGANSGANDSGNSMIASAPPAIDANRASATSAQIAAPPAASGVAAASGAGLTGTAAGGATAGADVANTDGAVAGTPASAPKPGALESAPRRAIRRAEGKAEMRRLAADAMRGADGNGDERANDQGRPGWVGARQREGRECLLQSHFTCAMERADQVLAAEPGNGLAQELKRRALAAQEAALASDWKMR